MLDMHRASKFACMKAGMHIIQYSTEYRVRTYFVRYRKFKLPWHISEKRHIKILRNQLICLAIQFHGGINIEIEE